MSGELDRVSAIELSRLIRARDVSPVEVTSRALEKAHSTRKTLNCFVTLMPEAAMAAARKAEAAVMSGDELGPLHGLPFSAKDLMAVKGVRYASGSRAMADNIAAVDAPAVERARNAGAILIGKTTTSEFGCKPIGDSPLTGITRHPWNLEKTPGGSSAGAAASVAAGITPLALGTDGGGSIRIPCSFCGLVGIKGQFGRVPVWPTSATPTLAHVGPIARDVADAALLFAAIAGHDLRDPASVVGPVPDVEAAARARDLKGLRVAYSPTFGYARPSRDVIAVTDAAAKRFEDLGCTVELVEKVFDTDPAHIWTAEFYAGVGTRLRSVLEDDAGLLDPAVADILHLALEQSMQDYYERVFCRYQEREKMRLFFERYDLLISPVVPVSSLQAGVNIPPGLEDRNLVSWVYYTYPFNLTGQPAASVPAGFGADGMPVGLHIAGRSYREDLVVRAAAAFEDGFPAGHFVRPFEDGA